jgi:hypothetical protein
MVVGSLIAGGCASRSGTLAEPETVRVGVYDTRAVSLAFGRSAMHARSLDSLLAEHRAAKDAGDVARVRELEEKGGLRQVRMHLQVFSNAPADDAMEAVRERLAGVATHARVRAIVPMADYREASVELVDVTDELVTLFDPTPETRKMASDLRARRPEPIEVIARLPADK